MINLFPNFRLTLLLLLIGFFTGLRAQAQGGGPGDGGPTPTDPPPDPTEIPIDGGASLLVAGGVAYGLKKIRDRKLKK